MEIPRGNPFVLWVHARLGLGVRIGAKSLCYVLGELRGDEGGFSLEMDKEI